MVDLGEGPGTPPLCWVGSIRLCRHNFEHNAISGTVGIMLAQYCLIFLQHNAVVSKNSEKCMQSLPATHSGMYKVGKGGNILVT